MDAIAGATYIAQTARECWEPIWPAWKRSCHHPDPDRLPASLDTCITTSFALHEMLSRCLGDWHWHVMGGRPTPRTPKGGYWLPDGRGGPHLWVEGRRHLKRITVDITADQFGGPEIIAVPCVPATHVANATRALLRRYRENEQIHIGLWTTALVFALQEQARATFV